MGENSHPKRVVKLSTFMSSSLYKKEGQVTNESRQKVDVCSRHFAQ